MFPGVEPQLDAIGTLEKNTSYDAQSQLIRTRMEKNKPSPLGKPGTSSPGNGS